VLIGADLDESPMAYRRLPEVIAQHAGTVKVLHTLRPFAVAMAGAGEFDPFKDCRNIRTGVTGGNRRIRKTK
jgi:tRNA-splicing ligase RtcB